MINRELDGVYFRINREGKWCNVCFTDLNDVEAMHVIKDRSDEWLESLYSELLKVLTNITKIINSQDFDVACQSVLDDLKKYRVVDRLFRLKDIIRNVADYYDIVGEHE